jgi:Icc-related predicted phosphoesterase
MLIRVQEKLNLQVVSDLQLSDWRHHGNTLHLPIEPAAHVLLIAGDVTNGTPSPEDLDWLQTIDAFPDWPDGIFLVLGNHDLYGLDIDGGGLAAWRAALAGTRIQVLQRDVAAVRGVRIAGCTFWSDFDRESALVMLESRLCLSDYTYLMSRGHLATPEDVLQQHRRDLDWLHDLPPGTAGDPLVVMTHHAPSWMSIHPDRPNDPLNGAYATAAEWIMEQITPALWVHGHVHALQDYCVGSTRVVSRPMGYFGETVPVGRMEILDAA